MGLMLKCAVEVATLRITEAGAAGTGDLRDGADDEAGSSFLPRLRS
jgi:hypothetical protein